MFPRFVKPQKPSQPTLRMFNCGLLCWFGAGHISQEPCEKVVCQASFGSMGHPDATMPIVSTEENCVTPRKLWWQWKITIFNRRYIFKWLVFQCHISFPGCNFERQILFFEATFCIASATRAIWWSKTIFCVNSSNQKANGIIGIVLLTWWCQRTVLFLW